MVIRVKNKFAEENLKLKRFQYELELAKTIPKIEALSKNKETLDMKDI